MALQRVLFIRPGETDWNRDGRWQGWVAVPLNEHGRLQAKRLARFTRNLGLDALYSSDLKRTRETAEIIAESLPFDAIFDERLRERHIGEWQGLTLREIKDWYPQNYAELRADPLGYKIASGESRQDAIDRALKLFDEIQQKDEYKTVGILSHTTVIRGLLSALVPDTDPFQEEFANISVTTIAKGDDGVWRVVEYNDISHLDGMEALTVGEVER